ncbi:SGNH/GDSL hydrolase family protein [Candidatus Solirubrobacter pratensis]|uniref:SGNH/GDSL hydrolase family protein n=1 Tax=Candidatus Solirubrobacter pratensis TaxID=1298857 RepID=UPI00048083FC|nr:SGNH/GDSL hydrolase family protein [Candidatus Solirubrobacter pratensis]
MSYRRYVALGDSTTEGLEDRYPNGEYRGWADRLAERLAQLEPGFRYANLAVRGKRARHVREEQLEAAIALRPDLASVLAGLNDMLRRTVDVDAVAHELETMAVRLRGPGADLLLVALPDPVPVNPLARLAGPHVVRLNAAIRDIAARHGAFLIDLESHRVASDPRLWHVDRLHGNPEGHRRIAAAAAELLGLPGADHSWAEDFPAAVARRRHERLAAHAVWAHVYFRPRLLRRLRGRSSGDGRAAKRPQLDPLG